MNEGLDHVVENVKQGSTWLRILFIVGFCVVLYVAACVVAVLVLAQALFSVLTGKDNGNLRYLGSALTAYVSQLLDFVTYNSEFRPFPFAPFPAGTLPQEDAGDAQTPVTGGAPATSGSGRGEVASGQDAPAKRPAAKKSAGAKTGSSPKSKGKAGAAAQENTAPRPAQGAADSEQKP